MKNKGELQTRPERRDAAENRQRILDAALKLFEQTSVEQVSMNQIAIEAQIGPGTLYRRYRNKSELCLDLIKDNLVLLFDDIYAYLKEREADSPEQRLRGIISLFIRFRERKLELLRGVEEGALPASGKSTRSPSPVYHELHEIFCELFGEMTASESAGPGNVFKADMLLMALKNESYVFQREVRGYSPDTFLEQLCSTFIPTFEQR
ncbi:TetR/AcrR family transcriptional regulator [Paenibacillus cremeus]|uniref:TetR/AcrR family transcriptional regulator n=1 Tax=Paenibacillus cremeus TaxID=2163881 RepID=A0A559KH00_9BACL|nr:TetR/AcrR family transcriptional regulator [Paenibacillus cremeus]TVY11358.1 TetR/AcrR family transcriptional regulator [Paenibacillus cremeus]